MPFGQVISQQGLANLATYKYSGNDQSIMNRYFCSPYVFNPVLNFIPTWIAPNLLTLGGFISVVLGYIAISTAIVDTTGEAPWWVYVLVALSIWVYQLLDNLDGKQARKTGSSSPLGEFFDHGFDSLTTPLFTITMGLVFELGPTYTYTITLLLIVVFWCNHWESFFTGVLVLGPVSNPIEAQVLLMCLYIFTAIVGGEFWRTRIDFIFATFQLNELIFMFYVLGSTSTIFGHFRTVRAWIAQNQPTPKDGRHSYDIISTSLPIIICVCISVFYFAANPQLLFEQPRLFLLTIGCLFSYTMLRHLALYITKDKYEYWFFLHAFFIIPIFNCFLNGAIISDYVMLWIMNVLTVCHCLFIIVAVTRQFSSHLNIHPFRISPVNATSLPH